MKNAIIFHGTGETDHSFWFPYTKRELVKKGYIVNIPNLPHSNSPDYKLQLPVALKEAYTHETVLIGHSSGCPLMLSVLENITVQIKQAIMVSGFARHIGGGNKPMPELQENYNWVRIKKNCNEFIFINSDNDPWGCNDVEGRYMLDHLGGKLVVMKGEGHMGSDTFKQPYKEFPFLIKLID